MFSFHKSQVCKLAMFLQAFKVSFNFVVFVYSVGKFQSPINYEKICKLTHFDKI